MPWVKKEDGGDGHTYVCNGCNTKIAIKSNWDAPVSNTLGTWCLKCVDEGKDTAAAEAN